MRRIAILVGVAVLLALLALPADGGKATGSGSKELHDVDGDDLLEGVIGDKEADLEESDLDDELDDGEDSDDEDSDSEGDDDDEGGGSTKALRSEIEFFKEHDKDSDGFLTLAEYQAAMNNVHSDAKDAAGEGLGGGSAVEDDKPEDAMIQSDFNEEDANKDGKLSLDEWLLATFHEDPQDEAEDSDDDDESDDEEPMTAAEVAEARTEAEAEFAQIDADHNGFVTESEMLAFVQAQEKKEAAADAERTPLTEAEINESVKDLYTELDQDKDGKVTFPEFFEVQYDVPRSRQDEKPEEEAPKIASQ